MKFINTSNEEKMLLEFLKGELLSDRFNKKLMDVLNSLNIGEEIIEKGNIKSSEENKLRKKIAGIYRGYPNKGMFNNFPQIEKWNFVKFEKEDIEKIYYINYDYWNELSNGTSKSTEAAKNIKSNIEIYNIPNKPFIEGLKKLENNNFPPIILITCNNEKFLIIEGHSRMTIYGLKPEKFEETYGFVGYCTEEEMKLYDPRMVI